MSSPPSTPASPKSPKNSGLDFDSTARGSNLRRSRRISGKSGITSEEENQDIPVPSQNVDKMNPEESKSNKMRVYSSRSKKDNVFEKENAGDDCNELETLRGSYGIASKSTICEKSASPVAIEPNEAKNVEKRKGGSLGIESKKARTINLFNDKGGVDGESSSGSDTDSEDENGRKGKPAPSVEELESKEDRNEEETIAMDPATNSRQMGSRCTRRRSVRLSAKTWQEQTELDLGMEPRVSASDIAVASVLLTLREAVHSNHARRIAQERRARFRNVARENAPHFAHVQAEEGVEANATAPSSAMGGDALRKIEDLPGPFSTAMKIIQDRIISTAEPVIHWIPSKGRAQNRVKPSLQDLCLDILCKNSESIVSLESVPDELKNKLSRMVCDSRKMDSRFMQLLVAESSEKICVKDCSWMTEEEMKVTFGKCDTSKISTLELDLCGRCMTDYVLRDTLAPSVNCMPALVCLSLKGACRVSDGGLSSLLASAPSLRSINLSQCSLITFGGIDAIADHLGLLLRELYLDDCQSIDAMLILPALTRLERLQVFSTADLQSVCDDFVGRFLSEPRRDMKELGLANCGRLTDISMKAIAENCPGLRALDVTNLNKLTDFTIAHIANGCPSIQKLILRRNAFSDEAVAAFLQVSGNSLVELSLNSITKVGPNTAISLAGCCSRNLVSLDISWCRSLTDEVVGHIVDGCSALRLLKMFGCTQITNVFLDGYSNPLVQIIGLQMTPILEHLNLLDTQQSLLRYSPEPES